MPGFIYRNDTAMPQQRELKLNDGEEDHSARMRAYLQARIAASAGWVSFEQFMEMALYAPGLGYYSAGARKFGAGGDFTTAPEMSGLFGACVARQCAEILGELGGGSILELGAGSGRLAADILLRLEGLGQLPASYRILDISADLRERQQRHMAERAPHLLDRVSWIDEPPEASFDGVIVANEVLDALPVSRFRWYHDRVEEIGVALSNGALTLEARPAPDMLAKACEALAEAARPQIVRADTVGTGTVGGETAGAGTTGHWEDGYVSEYCPRLSDWTMSVTRALRAGAVLWFDYGLPRSQYYLAERRDGTLMCHFHHRAHNDPLFHPGLQDITAWVDYTLLAEASRSAGFALAGFTTQTYFLAGLGIDREMHAMAGQDANRFARLANEARQLMLPGEMGERFKAMAWLRELDLPLSGFALQDLRHTL